MTVKKNLQDTITAASDDDKRQPTIKNTTNSQGVTIRNNIADNTIYDDMIFPS